VKSKVVQSHLPKLKKMVLHLC